MITFSSLNNYGRFGNQLFQIAATVAHSLKMNEPYLVNPWKYSKYFNNINQSNNIIIKNIYVEEQFYYKSIEKKNIDLKGYFQSEKYFINYNNEIRELFKPNKNIILNLKEKYKDILKKSVSIHIRRTDYIVENVNRKSLFVDLGKTDYYKKAIEFIKKNKKIDNVLIFSDDIEWCKNNMSEEYHYIHNDDVSDMFLMSLCGNNIIANSSFSWWSSWLNEDKNKIIIAPKNWFNFTYDAKDIYTKEMIII